MPTKTDPVVQNTCSSQYSPLGILLLSKDEAAEHVLFMYPFNPDLNFEGFFNFLCCVMRFE